MMREIVFDTETTGLDPADGHRVIELGCVELIDHLPTGESFHAYLNPERDGAGRVAARARPQRRIPGRQAAVLGHRRSSFWTFSATRRW